jgi:hypothetical protein
MESSPKRTSKSSKFDSYRDSFHNDMAAEVRRLETRVAESEDPATRQELQAEADSLSRELVRYLNSTTKGEFRHHSVTLPKNEFAPFETELSWTAKSLKSLPQRKMIIDRIFQAHQARVNDLFLVEEVDSRQRPTGRKVVLFLDETGPAGGRVDYRFTVPRVTRDFMSRMGLTANAAQRLYFGDSGPVVFTGEKTRKASDRKL